MRTSEAEAQSLPALLIRLVVHGQKIAAVGQPIACELDGKQYVTATNGATGPYVKRSGDPNSTNDQDVGFDDVNFSPHRAALEARMS